MYDIAFQFPYGIYCVNNLITSEYPIKKNFSCIPEELRLNEFAKRQGDWEHDFDSLIPHLLEENQSAYLFFR